jgi:hypothetical protein
MIIDGDRLCCNLVNGLRVQKQERMHEHFYVIKLLIEADVVEIPPRIIYQTNQKGLA